MSIVPEKIALQHLLQHHFDNLTEAIVQFTGGLATAAPVPCRFCADHIIAWADQQHVFSPCTYMLLKHFFEAPNMMLFKEDVRQDVIQDDDAREGTVRQCILAARKELRRTGFPYRIETITRKGYRLVAEATGEATGKR